METMKKRALRGIYGLLVACGLGLSLGHQVNAASTAATVPTPTLQQTIFVPLGLKGHYQVAFLHGVFYAGVRYFITDKWLIPTQGSRIPTWLHSWMNSLKMVLDFGLPPLLAHFAGSAFIMGGQLIFNSFPTTATQTPVIGFNVPITS